MLQGAAGDTDRLDGGSRYALARGFNEEQLGVALDVDSGHAAVAALGDDQVDLQVRVAQYNFGTHGAAVQPLQPVG